MGVVRRTFHKAVWQRLPRGLRRAALQHLMSAITPRPSRSPRSDEGPVIVAGFLRAASGLGESARLSLEALRQCGVPAHGWDLSETFFQEGSVPCPHLAAPGADLSGPGAILLVVNAPFVSMALRAIPRPWIRGKRVLGYWAWELPETPPDWTPGHRFVHAVCAPSRFTADAIATGGRQTPHVLWYPVALRAGSLDPQGPPTGTAVRILTVFNAASSFSRKNPLASVEAFRRAYGDDPSCTLTVKAQNAQAYPEGFATLRAAVAALPNATLDERTLPLADVHRLIASHDVLLSLHRSEGFGLTIAEAMLAGRPAVATGWSGNTDFLTPDVGCPVAFRLVPAVDAQHTYDQPDTVWAEPDVDHAAACLRELRDPERRAVLGARARHHALRIFGPETFTDRLSAILGRAPRDAGAPAPLIGAAPQPT